MTQRFVVGDRVIIRYGKRAGAKATVMKVAPDQVYQVKSEDGAVLFFTGVGLEAEGARPPQGRHSKSEV
jgi:ribosomal protein L24